MDNIQWGNSTRAQDIINGITGVGLNSAPNTVPTTPKSQPSTPEFPKNSWESYATSPKRAIRTYRADTADLLKSEPVSLAHITISEQSKGTNTQVIRNFAPASRNYIDSIKSFFRVALYTLISLFLVTGAVMLLILGVSQYKFGFLGQGLNNLADNYAGRIYTFFGFTKTSVTPAVDNNEPTGATPAGSNNLNKPIFGNTNNQTGSTNGNQNPNQSQPVTGTRPTTNQNNNPSSPVNTPGIMLNGIIKVDYEISTSIRRGVTLSSVIQDSIANKNLNESELAGIHISNPKDNETTSELTSEELLIAIASRAPELVRKSLNNEFVVGYSGPGKNPFLILTTDNFPEAFAGMLAWENSLYDDFATIFNLPTLGVVSAVQRQVYEYSDGVILSRDVRILKNSGDLPPLYYGFTDKNTVLITTSDTIFKKITERLDSAAYIRQK